MARFDFSPTPIPGLVVVQRKRIEDSRGFLSRFFCAEEFQEIGLKKAISQINHTLTRQRGALRGMHFQHAPHAEAKVVSCLRGQVLDVAIDLRRNSPTFLRWHAEALSEENQRSLFIPEGFAHGFQTMTEDCELVYLHTTAYQPTAEGALNALDPGLDIAWPLAITEMSERDRQHPMLTKDFQGIEI